MGSMWRNIRQQNTPVNKISFARVADIDEIDPYYFIAKDAKGNIISEGELSKFKLFLPDEYLYAPIKKFTRDEITMIATIQF